VFEDVNLEVYEGERIALVGPNGAGKTTFMLHFDPKSRTELIGIINELNDTFSRYELPEPFVEYLRIPPKPPVNNTVVFLTTNGVK